MKRDGRKKRPDYVDSVRYGKVEMVRSAHLPTLEVDINPIIMRTAQMNKRVVRVVHHDLGDLITLVNLQQWLPSLPCTDK